MKLKQILPGASASTIKPVKAFPAGAEESVLASKKYQFAFPEQVNSKQI
jgi:hypothetical protein